MNEHAALSLLLLVGLCRLALVVWRHMLIHSEPVRRYKR